MSEEILIQTVPNFSEGRDLQKVEQLVDVFRARPGVKLLDYSSDPDHNRCVVTVVGNPEPLKKAVLESVALAVELIDMNRHDGKHPRIGAVDVIPFVPVRNCGLQDADRLARAVGRETADRFDIPVYLYEKSAASPYRKNLADIRRGQFEGLREKMKDPAWAPDFGFAVPHPTAGAVAVGARMPLVCFNVNLDTPNLETAKAISRRVRQRNGGLQFVKALAISLEERNMVQVTMNLTDYTQTSIYSAFEMVKMEARRYGVRVVGSEVVGIVPMKALVDCAEYYLQIEDFSIDQVLESQI